MQKYMNRYLIKLNGVNEPSKKTNTSKSGKKSMKKNSGIIIQSNQYYNHNNNNIYKNKIIDSKNKSISKINHNPTNSNCIYSKNTTFKYANAFMNNSNLKNKNSLNNFKNIHNKINNTNDGNMNNNINNIMKSNTVTSSNVSNRKYISNRKIILTNNKYNSLTNNLNNIINKNKSNHLYFNTINNNFQNKPNNQNNINYGININQKIINSGSNNKNCQKNLNSQQLNNNNNINHNPNNLNPRLNNTLYIKKAFNCNTDLVESNKILLNTDEMNNLQKKIGPCMNPSVTEPPNIQKSSSKEVFPNYTGIYETDNVTVTYDKKKGNKIVNEFYFLDTIGRGAYSKVKKCINLKTKEEFAVKILNKRLLRKKKKSYGKTKEGTLKINYMIDDAINEINIYKSFPTTNENIIRLYQILNDNKKDKTYLIMELAGKGPLVTLNEKTGVFTLNNNYDDSIYDEKLMKTWIYDIANGLKFLHENNIVHRDIKSDNLLIDKNGHCKIADFGCSIKMKTNNELFSKTEGNMYFFPPEFVDGKSKKLFSYKPVDVWAFGVSIYTCIFKSLPFLPENRENVVELFKEIREANFDFNKNGIKISKEMETLLRHIFERDPEKRFTAKDIVEYPWLNGGK